MAQSILDLIKMLKAPVDPEIEAAHKAYVTTPTPAPAQARGIGDIFTGAKEFAKAGKSTWGKIGLGTIGALVGAASALNDPNTMGIAASSMQSGPYGQLGVWDVANRQQGRQDAVRAAYRQAEGERMKETGEDYRAGKREAGENARAAISGAQGAEQFDREFELRKQELAKQLAAIEADRRTRDREFRLRESAEQRQTSESDIKKAMDEKKILLDSVSEMFKKGELSGEDYNRAVAAINAGGTVNVQGGSSGLWGFGKKKGKLTVNEPEIPAAPAVGDIREGHRFKGGDPTDSKNWEKVQ